MIVLSHTSFLHTNEKPRGHQNKLTKLLKVFVLAKALSLLRAFIDRRLEGNGDWSTEVSVFPAVSELFGDEWSKSPAETPLEQFIGSGFLIGSIGLFGCASASSRFFRQSFALVQRSDIRSKDCRLRLSSPWLSVRTWYERALLPWPSFFAWPVIRLDPNNVSRFQRRDWLTE